MTKNQKKERQEILSRWRQLGFLEGLKQDGITEWRCAKSFDLMAQYMLHHKEGTPLDQWQVVMFPIIRKCTTQNKNRITKVIQPQHIIDFITNTTIADACNFIQTLKGKQTLKYITRCFHRYTSLQHTDNKPIIEIFQTFTTQQLQNINHIFGIDFDAEVCVITAEFYTATTKQHAQEKDVITPKSPIW